MIETFKTEPAHYHWMLGVSSLVRSAKGYYWMVGIDHAQGNHGVSLFRLFFIPSGTMLVGYIWGGANAGRSFGGGDRGRPAQEAGEARLDVLGLTAAYREPGVSQAEPRHQARRLEGPLGLRRAPGAGSREA